MTNNAQIWLILANCDRIYGQKWLDLWPNEIVGMAIVIVAIPDITSMISNLFMWTNFVKVLLKHPFQILLMPVATVFTKSWKWQSAHISSTIHESEFKMFCFLLTSRFNLWLILPSEGCFQLSLWKLSQIRFLVCLPFQKSPLDCYS